MANLSITACSFFLKKQNCRNESDIYNLNDPIKYCNEDGNEVEISFENLLKNFVSQNTTPQKKDELMKTYSCEILSSDTIDTDKYKVYTLKIMSGNYGSASTIYDADTRVKKLEMKPTDVAEKKFYLFVVIPKDNAKVKVNKGMLIFQNLGIYGVKTITTDLMREYFSTKYQTTLICRTISPSLFVEKVLKENNIKKMTMTINHPDKVETSGYFLGYGVESKVVSNLRFKSEEWDRIKIGIRNLANGSSNIFEFESINYNELKLDVVINGKVRVVSLKNIDRLSIIEDLPDYIRDADGYADISSLKTHIKTVISDYLNEMTLHIKNKKR